jgi:hypothetical protein
LDGAENIDELETSNADKRTDKTADRMRDPGPAETRQISADEGAAESSGTNERTKD